MINITRQDHWPTSNVHTINNIDKFVFRGGKVSSARKMIKDNNHSNKIYLNNFTIPKFQKSKLIYPMTIIYI
jgi:hypothetical protein